MDRKPHSSNRLEALGLQDYSSDASSNRSSTSNADTWDVTNLPDHNSAEAASASRAAPTSNDKSERRNGLKSAQLHRDLAYETLIGASRESRERYKDNQQHQQQHPSILRPGSAASSLISAASKHGSPELQEARPTSQIWKPQKPAYAQYVGPKSDSESSVRPLSMYDAYRPLPPLPPQEQGRGRGRERKYESKSRGQNRNPKPTTTNRYGAPTHEDGDNNPRSSYSSSSAYSFASHSADPFSRRSRIAERTEHRKHNSRSANNHTARFSFQPINPWVPESSQRVSGAPRSVTPRQPATNSSISSTTSPSSSSTFSVPPPSPSTTVLSRSPSPGRGAWISDQPHQERPSLTARARERMRKNLHLNLQKVGRRPRSSFVVHSVVRSPVADIATGLAAELERARPAPSECSRGRLSLSLASSGSAVLDDSEDLLGTSEAEAEAEFEELRAWIRYVDSFPDTSARKTTRRRARARSVDSSDTRTIRQHDDDDDDNDDDDDDELFLEGSSFDTPIRDSFFPSEWAQRERVLLDQESTGSYFVAPLAIRSKEQRGQDATGARHSGDSLNDRAGLPSQHKRGGGPPRLDTLPPYPPLCETPERMPLSSSLGSKPSRKSERGNWI
ncbi:hypothetical protein Hte_001273 [Hypoxylon texense]